MRSARTRRQAERVARPARVLVSLALCFGVAAALMTHRLAAAAGDLPDGVPRAVFLPLTGGMNELARLTNADRPAAAIAAIAQPGDEQPAVADADPTDDTTSDDLIADDAPVSGPMAVDDGAALDTELVPTPQPTPVPHLRTITVDAPLRVYVGGDSFVDWLGYQLARYAAADHLISSRFESKLGSGLALPSFYDWHARVGQVMDSATPPEAVVLFMGANDSRDIRTPDGTLAVGSAGWATEYAKRVAAIMDLAGDHGAQLYWVGLPVMRDPARTRSAATIDAILDQESATRSWVHFVDIRWLFVDSNGRYTAYRPDDGGLNVKVRQDDGIHLTQIGTDWVARVVYQQFQQDWNFRP